MKYKSMILELLKQRPDTHDQLKKERKLLPTMEQYAKELRASHLAWQQLLSSLRPGSDPSQIASEALEIALKEMQDRLPSESGSGSEAIFLDAAMLFNLRHTPRA